MTEKWSKKEDKIIDNETGEEYTLDKIVNVINDYHQVLSTYIDENYKMYKILDNIHSDFEGMRDEMVERRRYWK